MSVRRVLIPSRLAALLVLVFLAPASVRPAGAAADRQDSKAGPKTAAPIERLSPDRLRVGNVHIDMARQEVSVTGTITDAMVLEFIAVAKGGFKAYESALELETSAINFNLALILIGLDPSRAVVPKFHIDPDLPKGDPVDVWIEWDDNGRQRRARAEEIVYNEKTKKTLTQGPWVYTGSVFAAESNAYLAEIEGTLIGFVHSPAPVIDSPRPLPGGDYGANKLNPALNLAPGMSVTLKVRALPRNKPS
jgi:hypothetical protein